MALNEYWQYLTRPSAEGFSCHKTNKTAHGNPISVAVDEKDLRHMLIPAGDIFPEIAFESSGVSAVSRLMQGEDKGDVRYLDIMCREPGLNEIFTHLCDDIYGHIDSEDNEAAGKALSVLEQWRDLFGFSQQKFGKNQITGLIGELYFLSLLADRCPSAVQYWMGPDSVPGRHDFACGESAIEIKSTLRRFGRFHSISGHLQLEEPHHGALHLVTITWESVPQGKYSLESLTKAICEKSGVYARLLIQKLDEFGYRLGGDIDIDRQAFNLLEERCYKVNENFPRIIPSSFRDGKLPHGILRLDYTIDLTGEPPHPLSKEEYHSLLTSFAEGRTCGA